MGKTLLYQSSLVNALVRLNETKPHFVIIEEGNQAYTVNELYDYALHLAKGMAKKGLKQHSRVVIAMPPSFLFLAYIIACTMNAATIVLIDPEMGRENYLSKLKQINPQFAVLDKRLLLIQEHPIIKFLALKFKGNIPSFSSTVLICLILIISLDAIITSYSSFKALHINSFIGCVS